MSDSPPLPELPTFAADAQVCGNCKLWRARLVDHRGWVGECRLHASRGDFPPSAPICDAFAPRGTSTVPVAPPTQRASAVRSVAPVIRRPNPPPDAPVHLDLSDADAGELSMTRDELMEIFREASGQVEVPLAPKWEGGHIQLVPGKTDLQGKELPIDAFFHKIVMVRDRLRTLEQKLNGHPKLTDAEKVDLQQYITRIYGSLTSFNVMFREKADQFVGQKSDE